VYLGGGGRRGQLEVLDVDGIKIDINEKGRGVDLSYSSDGLNTSLFNIIVLVYSG
jgi:hypothetical protein